MICKLWFSFKFFFCFFFLFFVLFFFVLNICVNDGYADVVVFALLPGSF